MKKYYKQFLISLLLLPLLMIFSALRATAQSDSVVLPSDTITLPSEKIVLPVEVMGQDGALQTVLVNVPTDPATILTDQSIAKLSMRVHGLTYADKASVQINAGDWIPLDNSTATVAEPGKSYGGIGGAFSTLSLTVPLPADAVHTGINTINFRFNATDGVSAGFRVLAFNFLTADGQAVLPASTFVQDDPSTWTAPLPDDDSIAAGKNLWHSAALVKSSGDNTPILATCADCHSEDGRDLKYFSYSNYSIIARSQFHGLSELQGAQIASYIRSLPVPSYGRPWNPPYQPGLGTDSKPIEAWAAGAGADAVLDNDAQTLPYLFPHGINGSVTDTGATLNLRELPVDLPLPDWNHWLPTVHPKDAFGDSFTSSAFSKQYGDLRSQLLNPDPDYHQWFLTNYGRGVRAYLSGWRGRQLDFLRPIQDNPNKAWTPELAEQISSAARWHIVKEWELEQEFSLEGLGPAIYGPGAESRTWLSGSVFQVSPALLSIPNDGVTVGTNVQYQYEANAWYYLQAILSSGNRHREGWTPIDWGYAKGRVSDLSRATQRGEFLRYTAMIIKGEQQSDITGTVDTTAGWFPVWAADLKQFTFVSLGGNGFITSEPLDPDPAVDFDLKRQIEQALTQSWFTKMIQFKPADYYAAGMAAPTDQRDNRNSLYNSVRGMLTPQGGGYTSLYQQGINPYLLNRIADWAKTLWPGTDWNAFKP